VYIDLEGTSWGTTYLQYVLGGNEFYAVGEIYYAEIYINKSMIDHPSESLVIAHEIGHTLGLAHVPKSCVDNVMAVSGERELKNLKLLDNMRRALNDTN
jgi:Zn-dependent peptidase ImmA (M78 family)